MTYRIRPGLSQLPGSQVSQGNTAGISAKGNLPCGESEEKKGENFTQLYDLFAEPL